MLRRIVAVLALLAVVLAIVDLSARAATCTGRLTVSVDGVPQPACARLADAFGSERVRSYLYSGLTLTGQVLTGSGSPAAGAPVSVQSSALDGTDTATLASGVTDAAGWYALRAPAGASRLLTVNAPGDQLMVRELVAPNVYLRVHAQLHAGIVLWGHVLTGNNPPTVVLQDLAPNGWQTFGVAAPASDGAYRYIYHSAAGTIGDRFAIRATTMPTSLWQAGVSGVHDVTVRP